MTTTAKRLVAGSQLTAAADDYYTATVPTVIKAATVCNTTAGAVTLTVYLVPSAGAPGAANTLISARSIAVGASDLCPELINQVIEAGGMLQALGLNLTLVASGVEIT